MNKTTNRNYKVSGAKLEPAPGDWDGPHSSVSEAIEYCKASGLPIRHLNHAYPSDRRYKRAVQKFDAAIGRESMGVSNPYAGIKNLKPCGNFERSIWREFSEDVADQADHAMGRGYY